MRYTGKEKTLVGWASQAPPGLFNPNNNGYIYVKSLGGCSPKLETARRKLTTPNRLYHIALKGFIISKSANESLRGCKNVSENIHETPLQTSP